MLHWRWSVAAGASLAAFYAASPLMTLALAAGAVLIVMAGCHLPELERRRLRMILLIALGARFAFIAAMLITDLPLLNDLSVGALKGDDAYYIARAIRARDLTLGLTASRYDYFVVSDEYGRTSYLQVLTVLQTLLGPAPYGIRALNAVLFVAAAYLLFRLARRAYGATASALALVVTLFLPSLFVSSTSLVKESTYFFVSALLLTLLIAAVRERRLAVRLLAVVAGAACLWVLDDLRRGALVLAIGGVITWFAIYLMFQTPRRAASGLALAAIIAVAAWRQPAIHERAIDGITSAAKMHAGHVFTIGHAYKLLDDGFYMHPGTPMAWQLELTDGQAARFLIRAAKSFLVTPWPWEMVSRSELLFLPEHLVWLLIVAFAPIGVAAGARRDWLITSLLVGFVLPTAAALAVTTGNVGTLLRLRGIVSPFLIIVAAVGVLSVAEYLLGRRMAGAPRAAEAVT